ncbi:hypothetical protein CRENBAI_009890, partial [Crenichthys baileyi]
GAPTVSLYMGPWGSPPVSIPEFGGKKRHVEAPRCGSTTQLRELRRYKITSTQERGCVLEGEKGGREEEGTYLCNGLFIPHGCLFDKALHFNNPISTRNDHPRPPETHRHFHGSSTALIPKRKKRRPNDDNNHPRAGRVCESVKVKQVNPDRDRLCELQSSEEKQTQAPRRIQRQGWVPSSLVSR